MRSTEQPPVPRVKAGGWGCWPGKVKLFVSAAVLLAVLPAHAWAQEETDMPERRHPGHKMAVQFIPAKDSFSIDEPVMVTLKIQSIGDVPFKFMRGGRQRGARDNQFAFSAEQNGRVLPDVGDPVNWGGLGTYVNLDPGADVEIPVELTKWFKFTEPGVVLLRGSYSMDFADPESTDYFKIWEDFACAEFSIRIE